MHSDDSIHVASCAGTRVDIPCCGLHLAECTSKHEQMHAADTVDCRQLDPSHAELNMHKVPTSRCCDRKPGLFAQFPFTGLLVVHHCAKGNSPPIASELSDTTSIRPSQLPEVETSLTALSRTSLAVKTHVQHPVRCISAMRRVTLAGSNIEGSSTSRPTAPSPNKSSMVSPRPASPMLESPSPTSSIFRV